MKFSVTTLLIHAFLLVNCSHSQHQHNEAFDTQVKMSTAETDDEILTDSQGRTLDTRFHTPPGYTRIPVSQNSFATYLRQLPLKPAGAVVKYYNGRIKPNRGVYVAVVDLPVGNKDLHQCADAVMRLRAEYLWKQEQYDDIHFNFTNGFRVDYAEWRKGRRIVVEGNNTYWNQRSLPSESYEDFWKYLETIFMYAGTLSLSQELPSVSIHEMQVGNIFIQGGSPGHAVIVVDMAEHKDTGRKIFMLAQSYMPAQEIQILENPGNHISPWYELTSDEVIQTPEWRFYSTDLKRFE